MNWKVWTCAAALIFSGTLCAQAAGDVEKAIDEQMAKYDTNKDGKVTRAEYRDIERKESGVEDESSYDWLAHWKSPLLEFLAIDMNDNLEVDKPEFVAYFKKYQGADSETFGKLTKKDMSVLDDEYLEPAVKLMLTLLDADKNGKISQKEAEAADMGDTVNAYDTNGDSNLDGMEIKASEIEVFQGNYEIEEGYILKGEPSTAEQPDPAEIPEEVKKEFAKADTDKDGLISKAEMKASSAEAQENKAHWWGSYIAFLSMDSNDDAGVDVYEVVAYASDEAAGITHKFYPADRTEALNEIWLDLDSDKDSKVTNDEWLAVFPGNEEFAGVDADSNGDATKDEFWNMFKEAQGKAFEFPDKDREATTTTTPNGGTPNPDDPMWALYKKEGRSWTVKNTAEFMGNTSVTYMKTEVVKLAADHCVIRVTMLDAEKKESPYMKPTETKIEFKTAGGATGEAPKIKDLGTETIKVEAGEFECQVTEVVTEAAGSTFTTKSWSSKKYAGLSVKSSTTSKDVNSSSELVEFVD